MCKTNKIELNENMISLRWHQSYPSETHRDIETGLIWTFLYLGAHCNESNIRNGLEWVDDQVLTLQIDQMGFDQESLDAIRILVDELKQLSEYRSSRSIDVGRFVMYLYNESDNYYKITQMPTTLEQFEEKYHFEEQPRFITAYGESCVSSGIRIFNAAQSDDLTQIAYLAQEGYGETVDDFQVKEFEVFDFMDNGQPRFGIYNLQGDLIAGADADVSIAGKPAKCMWCHTSSVQPIISAASSIDGFERLDSFSTLIKQQNGIRRKYLRSQDLDFVVDSLAQHSLAELLYFTYEYPTPQRLRSEGLSLDSIADIDYHKNREYQFFNLVFDSMVHRSVIDPTFKSSARETVWTPE